MRKVLFLVFAITIFSCSLVFAVGVGDQLTAPEDGWQRIDDRDSNLLYSGSFGSMSESSSYLTTLHVSTSGAAASCMFDFTGFNLRIISRRTSFYMDSIKINVDGKDYFFDCHTSSNLSQCLVFQLNLSSNIEHSVVILGDAKKYFSLDAVDIDSTGKILPYKDLSTTINTGSGTVDSSTLGNLAGSAIGTFSNPTTGDSSIKLDIKSNLNLASLETKLDVSNKQMDNLQLYFGVIIALLSFSIAKELVTLIVQGWAKKW